VVAESIVALRREDELAAADALVLRRVDVVEVRLSALEGGTPGIVAGGVARHRPDAPDPDLGGGDTRLVDRRVLLRTRGRDTQCSHERDDREHRNPTPDAHPRT